MAGQATKEPTMEEILSSIRRIISEDGSPVGEASNGDEASTDAEDDFLGLSDELAASEDEQAGMVGGEHLLSIDELLDSDPEFTDFEALAEADAFETDSQTDSAEPEATLREVFDASVLDESVAEIEASIMEGSTSSFAPSTHVEAEAAIAEVAAAVETTQTTPVLEDTQASEKIQEASPMTEPVPTPSVVPVAASSAGGNPIENLVSEMMRPMIKEWIDTNLAGIVERKVEAEIQQVANKVVAALRND